MYVYGQVLKYEYLQAFIEMLDQYKAHNISWQYQHKTKKYLKFNILTYIML